ncbi:MAG: undecaprenyl phosphate translocase family protein [Phycisphaerales bacterium JB040]
MALGGALMGLANLVPGLSGGTMLVAVGIYGRVIDAVSEVTRLRFGRTTVLTLGVMVVAAGVAIGAFASAISYGLAEARWAMYSVFIGLTWGGAPLLVRLIRPWSAGAVAGTVAGIAGMLGLVWVQGGNAGGGGGSGGAVLLLVAGAAGASAMILPGVSGAYLLLLLGQYERIVGAIKDGVNAAGDADVGGTVAQLRVLVPVGVGVVIGIVVVSNLLRVLIHRFEKPTYGVLLGLLLAAPAGIYPFVEGVPPRVGDTFDGVVVTEENVGTFASAEHAKDWRIERFRPGGAQVGGSLGLIVLGFGATLLLSRLDRGEGDDGAGPGQDGESAG